MVTRRPIYFLSILLLPLLFVVQSAHADDMDFDIKIDPVLRIDVPSSSIDLELSPNQLQTGVATIGLHTNNLTGLTATISTASSGTALVGESFSGTKVVTKTVSSTTSTTASGTQKSSITDGSQYANSANYYQDVTFPDFPSTGPLQVTIYYATENVKYDWICVFEGTSYTPGSSDGCANALAPTTNTGSTSGNKIGGPGSNKSTYAATATYTVNSNTARIYFRSDISGVSYGFWAEVSVSIPTIPTLKTETTSSTFQAGFWGYSLDGEHFKGMPALGTGTFQIITENPSGNADHSLYLGAKVDEFQPATTYSNSIQVFAITNYVPMTFDRAFAAAGKTKYNGTNYYAMQDMSSAICNDVDTGVSNDGSDTQVAQLIDTRDNKVYWVAKLKTAADGSTGECWMTQNLDLNLNASTLPLKSATSDVSADWNPGSTYYTKTETSSSSAATDTYSWDLGNYYWHPQDNTSWTSCGASAKTYADCSATGKGFKTTVPTKDIANKDIDGTHYQVGTLYQWNTATAGTGGTNNTSKDVTSSICPANWRLPTSNSTTADRSFGKMLTAYGYSSWSDKKTISQAPLYFVPAGIVAGGTLRYAGNDGEYWSSMAGSSTSAAYYLGFNSSSVGPSYYAYYRYYGLSVRCVAR